MPIAKLDWHSILDRARTLAATYVTAVTLRQLHYLLVSTPDLGYPNTQYAYKRLSHLTAIGRREGTFPALTDLTRSMVVPLSFDGPADALRWLAEIYRRERSEGQRVVPVLLVEKATLVSQLEHWFTRPLGIPIAPLRGYSSESLEREVRDYLRSRWAERNFAALYLGDFDPSGEDIERNARRYLGDCFGTWHRIAVTPDLVDRLQLPENHGKETDSRSRDFRERHRRLVQVEIEAIAPDDLRELVTSAIDGVWDYSEHRAMLERERAECELLEELAEAQT